jgi:hypothetical protein
MAIVFDAPVEPDDSTAFVREVPVAQNLALLGEFPREDKDTNTIDFAEIVRTNRTAKFRAWDGRIHVSERDVGSEKRVKMLPLSTSLNMGEYERLQLEFSRMGGQNQQVLARAIYNESEQLTREVLNRLEMAWGDLLTDGKLTLTSETDGTNLGETDYGLSALGHLVAPTTAWSVANLATATPLTDIQTWADVWAANNGGERPARMKTSQTQLRIVQRSKEVIDAIYGSTQGRTRVKLSELNDLLDGEGLPTFDQPYDASFDVDGVTTRTVPDDRVAMLPADLSTLGATAWGVTATALELVNSDRSDMTFEEAPGIVGVVEKVGPPYRQFTYVDATAFPYLKNARKLLVADVR